MKRSLRSSVWFGVGLVLLTMPMGLTAEEGPVVATGAVVRLSAPSIDQHRISGTIVSADERILNVELALGRNVTVPKDGIEKLEVRTGRRSHWRAGLLAGLAAGVVLGAAAGCDNCFGPTKGEAVALLAPLVGIVGAGVGLLIRTDRWEPVSPHRLHVSLGLPARGRVGLSVGLNF